MQTIKELLKKHGNDFSKLVKKQIALKKLLEELQLLIKHKIKHDKCLVI